MSTARLPPLKAFHKNIGKNGRPGDNEFRFTIDSDAPAPAHLPAGDYILTWTAAEIGAADLKDQRFTVLPDSDKNILTIPPPVK